MTLTANDFEAQIETSREALSEARRKADNLTDDLIANLAAQRRVSDIEALLGRLESRLAEQQVIDRALAEEQRVAAARAECDDLEEQHHGIMTAAATVANDRAADLEKALAVIAPGAQASSETAYQHRLAFRRVHGRWPDFGEALTGSPYMPSADYLSDNAQRSPLYGVAAISLMLSALVQQGDSLPVALSKITAPRPEMNRRDNGLELVSEPDYTLREKARLKVTKE